MISPVESEWKRPESVLVVIYTADAQVLLLERARPDGFWQSVTGSLEWSEDAASAARRELREETGLDLTPRDCGVSNRFPILPEWRARYHPDVMENLEHVFAVELPGRCGIKLNPQEHRRFEWLDAKAAMQRCSSWSNAQAIDMLLRTRVMKSP
jgi:dATP pyrophosphohydrolase